MWAGISTDPSARVRSKQRPTEGCSRCERTQRREEKIPGGPEDWPGHERLQKRRLRTEGWGQGAGGGTMGKVTEGRVFLDLQPWA